jgi:hypothetical protein
MTVPLATLELTSARSPKEPLGTIALPVRDHLNSATVTSLLQTDWSFVGSEHSMDRLIIQGNILPLQRNEAIQRMRGEFLLFVDDDMVWQPDAVGRLVDTYTELAEQFTEPLIVGGLCFRRTPPHNPTLYVRELPNDGPYNFLEKWATDIVEVDATGMAFTLISKAAIEAVAEAEMPPLEVRQHMAGPPAFFHWTGRMGEDLRFCADAKAKGVRIFVDTRIEIGHIGEFAIGHKHYLQEIALRSGELEDERRVTNERFGLPTLSAAEARGLLGW